jgi:hypothetical protein
MEAVARLLPDAACPRRRLLGLHPSRFPACPMSPACPSRNLNPPPARARKRQRCSIDAATTTSMLHRCRQPRPRRTAAGLGEAGSGLDGRTIRHTRQPLKNNDTAHDEIQAPVGDEFHGLKPSQDLAELQPGPVIEHGAEGRTGQVSWRRTRQSRVVPCGQARVGIQGGCLGQGCLTRTARV